MHALSTIPLTGNAHFSPIALTNIYSRNPPFRIATGMKQSHTMKDFSILLIVIHLFISQNTCFGNQRRTISDDFGRHPRFRTAACCICPMSYALYHYRIKIRQIPEAATSINTSQYKTRNSSHLPHTLHRCTNLCRFRFTFDGLPRGDRPYRTYGREHNRSPMQRCTNSPRFRFTFDGHPRGDRPYRTYGSGSHRQPSAQVYQFVPFSVHLCRRATLKPSLQTLLQCSGPHGTAKVYPKSGKTVHLYGHSPAKTHLRRPTCEDRKPNLPGHRTYLRKYRKSENAGSY